MIYYTEEDIKQAKEKAFDKFFGLPEVKARRDSVNSWGHDYGFARQHAQKVTDEINRAAQAYVDSAVSHMKPYPSEIEILARIAHNLERIATALEGGSK